MNELFRSDSGLVDTRDLLSMLNRAREVAKEKPVRPADFVARCIDELDGDHYEKFVVQNSNKTETVNLLLTLDQCKLVAMRESKAVRRAVMQRLKELEGPQLPKTLSGALRLAADQAEQIERQQEALAIAAPKVEFVDQYVENSGSMTFRQVAKLLNANERKLRQFLLDNRIQYKLGGNWTAYQNHIDAGRFEVKTGTSQHSDHAFTEARFTPKGVEYVSALWRESIKNRKG